MTAPRILFLLNGPNRDSADLIGRRFESAGLDLDCRWAYDDDFPQALDGYDGAFLSGSPHSAYEDIPFIHREHDIIVDLVAREVPVLGVCFGSQILGSALCGRDQVFRRDTCDVGHVWLDTTGASEGDPLAKDLDSRFRMFVWHNDEVRADHPDMTILASTDACPNQVWRYRDKPVWGVQGHPEVTRDSAPQWMGDRRARLEADGADVDALIAKADGARQAQTLFDNFVSLFP